MSPSDVSRPAKPEAIFDRDAEWDALVAFACDARPGAGLGVVSGRLRQGKTHLLEALTAALGGFCFGAQQAARAESLHRLDDELARYTGTPPPGHRPAGWETAVDALLALGDRRSVPVVLDEFPDLVRQSPELPSIIHGAYRRLRDTGRDNRTRLLLSGSSLPVMHRLFGAAAPLHGLADLELTLRPLDFRQTARFWGIDDPRLALLVHTVVGGTPAYRRYAGDDAPNGPDDFDAWACRTVLNPRTPLFLEAHHLLQEETDHWDRALSHSALTARSRNSSGYFQDHGVRTDPRLSTGSGDFEEAQVRATGLLVEQGSRPRSSHSKESRCPFSVPPSRSRRPLPSPMASSLRGISAS